jgi:dihydroxyacid dehydratase/phosphogluconate dehydratase
MGFAREDYAGKPVIAIINTWSDVSHCHSHFRERAEDVKRGVWQAGGFPLEMPAITLAEVLQKPTTMMYRNFLAMETEELLRSYPVDGCVLMGGCDKTGPALLMGALSMNLPAIFVPAGPMLTGRWAGRRSAPVPTPGSTGTSCAPATSPSATGRTSRKASRGLPAPA